MRIPILKVKKPEVNKDFQNSPSIFRNSRLEVLQNSQEHTCTTVSFSTKLQAETCNFIRKETLAEVFCCEFCKISKHIRWLILDGKLNHKAH